MPEISLDARRRGGSDELIAAQRNGDLNTILSGPMGRMEFQATPALPMLYRVITGSKGPFAAPGRRRGDFGGDKVIPTLNGIDHVHVYVSDRDAAEAWYQRVLGFKRVEQLMVWAVNNGPLTLQNPEGNVHLALFERPDHPDTSAIAFGASGEAFLAWKKHLESERLEVRITDHRLAYSQYFSDPWGNLHEITTYDRDYVAEHLGH